MGWKIKHITSHFTVETGKTLDKQCNLSLKSSCRTYHREYHIPYYIYNKVNNMKYHNVMKY